MVRAIQERHVPGLAIAVVENGAITEQRAHGIANLETATPMTTGAVFELASVTKPITATAVMMLVEEGKVSLDAPISTYIDATPAAWAPITVRQLLTHTSGLDNLSLPRIQGAVPLRVTTAQMFDYLVQQPLRWPIGQNGWYSDAGYFLLGMIIERASGQSYRAFLQQRIFGPAGMTNSSVLDKERVLHGRVATYSWRDGQHVNWRRDWDYELPSFFGVFSTLKDLAAWDAALRRGALLRRASLEQMWAPATLSNGQQAKVLDDPYGLGWHLLNIRGHRAVSHSGASGTYLLRFLDQPLTIIVLTNLDSPSGRHHHLLARSIAGIVRPAYTPPHDLTPSPIDAEDTKVVQLLVDEIGGGRAPTVMSQQYRSWFDASPGWRAWSRSNLRGTRLTFLASDDLRGQQVWGGEPIARLVHCVAAAPNGRRVFLTVGLTADRQVASADFYLD
jgi:CubicO group peptidase (beta-lactamase class C family)